MSKLSKVKKWLQRPEGAFVALAGVFGFLFLIVTPPLQTPDEAAHFLRAYQISQGSIISEKKNNTSVAVLPKSIKKSFDVINGGGPIMFHPELKFRLGNVRDALKIGLNSANKMEYDVTSAAAYSPIGYIPQVLAISIGKIFNASPVLLIYLARLAALVCWLLLITAAIRYIPYKKWAVVAIGLLPMMVAQSVSPGVDAVSIGAGALFVAIILNSMVAKTISRKKIGAIAILATVMLLSKQISILLLPLILLVPNKRLAENFKRPLLVKSMIITIPILLFASWMLLVGNVGQTEGQIINQQSATGQLKYMLEHPFRFPKAMFNTFIFNWGDHIFDSLIGTFGWMDTHLPRAAIALGYIVLGAVLLLNYREVGIPPSRRVKLLLGGASILYFVAVCGAMYLLYSPVGANILVGVQGRYMLPILFLLVPLSFMTTAIVSKKRYLLSTIAPVVGLLILSLVVMVFRFYIDYKY